jgi:hypothetical protein
MNLSRLTMVFGAACLLLCATTANAQQNFPPQAAKTGQAAAPRCDVNCVRENAAKAAEACAPRIEAQAPEDFDWITRPNPGIFQQADPSSPSDSIVRYRGDSVRFMSSGKTWTRVSYECGYDVSAKTVSYVQVRSGRLDQPLAPTAPPNKSAQPPVVKAAASAPASVAASPRTAAAPRPPRPHVGEPSPIVIQQQSANPKQYDGSPPD